MDTKRAAQTTVPPPRRNYARWRATALLGVHVLIGLHIAHWLVAGRSLAPLEFNEVMHTLELGLVTAGFLLMATAILTTAVFGRFFCGWACHMLALQDLCAWLLGKFGIEAKPVRSRVLRTAPWLVMGYMFVWPQIARVLRGEPLPPLRVAGTDEAWASFVTEDFWRNLPGPWITGLTFLVCGFAIVYVLGSRAFCLSACPYGAVFALVDRVAPGRIRLRGACSDCGKCTAVCQSGIWVHEEVQRFGHVVDPACLRDLDCVAACPDGALSFGFGRPAGLQSLTRAGRKPRGYHWSRREDLWAAAAMGGAILAFRGLYGRVPFLMAVGIGCLAAGLLVLALRLWRAPHVRWRGLVLRRDGRLTGAGIAAAAAIGVLFAFGVDSGWVRWHEWRGAAAFDAARQAMAGRRDLAARGAIATALSHHEAVERWGWWNPIDHDRRLASLYALRGDAAAAVTHLQRIAAADAGDHEARLRLATALAALGRCGESAAELHELLRRAATGALPPALCAGAAQCAEGLAARLQAGGDAVAAAAQRHVAERLRAAVAR
jgi:polyferredoxin